VLVLKGRYLSSADGAARVSRQPSLFFNPAGTTHRDSFELAQGRFLAVSLSEQSRRIAGEGAKLPAAAIAFSQGAAVATAFRLAQECRRSEADATEIMEGLCWELVSNTAGERLWSQTRRPSWLRLALELLQDECDRQVRIADIAQRIGVHPVHLARAFRNAFCCTPAEYLARCRVRRAMTLLRGSNLPLAQIALASGFFDQSHFSRSFRQHFGVAPRAYRRDVRQDETPPTFNSYKKRA
jgi:AraC family transcriptional regulator